MDERGQEIGTPSIAAYCLRQSQDFTGAAHTQRAMASPPHPSHPIRSGRLNLQSRKRPHEFERQLERSAGLETLLRRSQSIGGINDGTAIEAHPPKPGRSRTASLEGSSGRVPIIAHTLHTLSIV